MRCCPVTAHTDRSPIVLPGWRSGRYRRRGLALPNAHGTVLARSVLGDCAASRKKGRVRTSLAARADASQMQASSNLTRPRPVVPQPHATRRFGQKEGSMLAADLSTCSPGSACDWSLALSLFFVTGFPYCQVPASIASFMSSSRARIRHSRRSLSFRTRTPSAASASQSHATPSRAQSSLARSRIAESLISVTAETILAPNACRMGALVNGHCI